MRILFALATAVLLLAACNGEAPFSQHPGFRAWYAAHPPSGTVPDGGERAILERYRPRLFVSEESAGPIDFYADYVGSGTLRTERGETIEPVTQAALNAHKAEPGAVFAHRPRGGPPHPVAYGRVDREAVTLPGGQTPFTFLTYNFVFPASGLPAGMPGWQRFFLDLVGDVRDWHQLDHYTAVTIALERGERPLAAIFQQHNYLRTYLLGTEDGPGRLALPRDGRLVIDSAVWSNELYPHVPDRTRHRAVPFLTGTTATYMIDGGDAPLLSADDITDPAREIDYALRFLAPDDAFYVFAGRLGERRWLRGRDGPPGADYNTLPALKSRAAQMLVFRWYEGDGDFARAYEALLKDGWPTSVDLAPFGRRFADELGR